MNQNPSPAGVKALAIAIPTVAREITLPSGARALRHDLPEGATGLDLEVDVARQVLSAARLDPAEVDLVISASFPALPEPCIGNATQVAWDLGMEKAASYNLESACAGGLLAIRTACQEVQLGEYENVLVLAGCPYSHTIEPGHPATDVIGDAAFAALVGPTRPDQSFLGSVIRNSGPTCPLVSWGLSESTPSGIRLEVGPKTAGQLEEWALAQVPELWAELLERTGVAPSEIRHWVINAPTASFVGKALRAVGARPQDGVDINRIAGNIGPALIGVSLFYSVLVRDFQPGDLVAFLSVGSESSLAIVLMRWPEDVALGEVPPHLPVETLKAFEQERLGLAAAA